MAGGVADRWDSSDKDGGGHPTHQTLVWCRTRPGPFLLHPALTNLLSSMEQKHSSPSLPSYYSSLVELYRQFTAQLKLLFEFANESCDSFLPTRYARQRRPQSLSVPRLISSICFTLLSITLGHAWRRLQLTKSNYVGRNGHQNKWIARLTQSHGGGSEQEDATKGTKGKTSQQEISFLEGRSQYRRHEFITRLTSSPPLPYYRHVFILDSRASRHVAGDKSLFSSPVRTITPSDSIAAAYRARDGRQLAVAGVGTISHHRGFQLQDVLYVPDIRTGVVLVSVPQLAERGYLVMLGGGQCHVKDQSSGKMVGKGRLHDQDGLYHLEFLNIPPNTADSTTPCLHGALHVIPPFHNQVHGVGKQSTVM